MTSASTMPIRIHAQRSASVVGAALCGILAGVPSVAQVHKVTATKKVVRAVAVYEWTGDLAKPTGARLIPVSLFIDGTLQDADIYRADPVPFALDAGNVYELQKAGIAQGTLAIAFARKLVPDTKIYTAWDDGWFGYGKFSPPAPPKPSNLRTITAPMKINGLDEDDDRPHFSARSATPGTGGAAVPAPGSAPAAASTPASDPDRPTLHRGSDSSTETASVPDDPDRPTLKKHSSAPTGAAVNEDVTAIGTPLADANRPILHRGKAESSIGEADLPKLTGLPEDHDLRQMVAVSDAADREPHDFSRPWADDTERAAILAKMQDAAHVALTAYEKANNLAPSNATAPPGGAAVTQKTAPAAHRPATRAGAKKPAAPPPPEPLVDEKLTGYLLSYGGSPTFVYSAHTDGLGAAERFVTVVAQENQQGEPEIALKNVTDAAHLDRTPRFRLVDAVDAEASNRASLLFELRGQNLRQFALYRVIGGRSDQSFVTGATE